MNAVNIDSKHFIGITINTLMDAFQQENIDCVIILLNAALHYATCTTDCKYTKLLLNVGADVNIIENIFKHIFTARKKSLGQGNVFTPMCHSVHKGGCIPACNGRGCEPPQEDTPLGRSPLDRPPAPH